jgi:alkylhydroperoxidase/carboxymuconolactone decarboxylase family protein YurZ
VEFSSENKLQNSSVRSRIESRKENGNSRRNQRVARAKRIQIHHADRSGVMSAKDTELLSIAFDASFTHMYAPGTRRHIHNALQAGATMEEIMEVLKLCIAQGVQACNLGVPILAEELEITNPQTHGA